MARPLRYFIHRPSIEALQERYGDTLEALPETMRLGIIAALSSAAHAVATTDSSEPLDVLLHQAVADTEDRPDAELYARLRALDSELSSYQEALVVALAIAQTIVAI